MCKFLLMQVKQSICRIELYNDNGIQSILGILMMFRIYSQCKLTRHKLNADTVVL